MLLLLLQVKYITSPATKIHFLSNTKNTRGKRMCTFYIVDPNEVLQLCKNVSSRTLVLRSLLDQNKGQ